MTEINVSCTVDLTEKEINAFSQLMAERIEAELKFNAERERILQQMEIQTISTASCDASLFRRLKELEAQRV